MLTIIYYFVEFLIIVKVLKDAKIFLIFLDFMKYLWIGIGIEKMFEFLMKFETLIKNVVVGVLH